MTTSLAAGDHMHTLLVDGRQRNYLLHVPQRYQADQPIAVVLALHGATSNAKLMQAFCGLDDKADEAGFLTVYPNGTGNTDTVLTWNAGECCGYAKNNAVDDVAFIRALLEDLASQIRIDAHRIYAAGMSNGAMMAYRLASECADRIAAIAAVAGPMAIDNPHPVRSVPVLHIHGTEDQFAPYHGGRGPLSTYGTDLRSVAETMAAWVRVNGSAAAPTILAEPPHVDDGTRIVRRIHAGGREGGASVILFTVEGGGHTWPGRPPFPAILGKSTQNLNANDVIWDFFAQHPM